MTQTSNNASPFGPTDNAFLEGDFGPWLKEEDYHSLEITDGILPPELEGRVLVRVGPNPTYKPLDMKYYHWFDGDGMVNAFYFHKDRVSYKNRFVNTEKHRLETAAGKALFGGLRSTSATTMQGWFRIKFGLLNLLYMGVRVFFKLGPTPEQYRKIGPVMNCANTNIVLQNGRLLALDEAGQPYQMELETLDTIGLYDYDNALHGPCIAHPVTDPETGYTYTIGYTPTPPYQQFYTISPESKVVDYQPIYVPFPAMTHTLSLTRKYFVFFHMPATFYLKNMGKHEPIRWQPELGARIGLLARDGDEPQPTWFDMPVGWMFHCMNSYDDGDSVVSYVAKFPRIPLLDLHTKNPSPSFTEEPYAMLVKWTINAKTGAFTEEIINRNYVEFPVMDDRFATRRQKHGWSTGLLNTVEKYGLWNTVYHYTFSGEEVTEEHYYCGEDSFIGECLFTPRHADSPEGDGFILTVMWNRNEDKSTLLVFDAQKVQDGPLVRILVPRRIEYDFHGSIIDTRS